MRGNGIDFVALFRQCIAQTRQTIGGTGRARSPLVDLLGITLVMAQTQGQTPALSQGDVILQHQRCRHVTVVLLRVLAGGRIRVLVLLVMEGRVQFVAMQRVVHPLHTGTLAHILVAAGRIVSRIAGVLVHVETVFIGVVVQTRLEHIVAIQAGGAQKVQAVLVPIGPAPVTHGVLLCGLAGIDRVALLTLLTHIAKRIFIRGIGRQPQLEGQALVCAVCILALAAGIGRLLFVILEAFGQGKAVGIQIRSAQLVVPAALIASQVEARLALAAAGKAQSYISLERLGWLARDQIDRTTQCIGAVQQRSTCLGHIDLGQVEGGETAQVHIAVIRHIQRHTIDVNGHLTRVEAAQVDHFLVAVVARQTYTGEVAHGIGHGVGIGALHLGTAHALHIACAKLLRIAPRADFDRAQREGLADCFGSITSSHLRPDRPHGNDGQSSPEPAMAKNKTRRMNLRSGEMQ